MKSLDPTCYHHNNQKNAVHHPRGKTLHKVAPLWPLPQYEQSFLHRLLEITASWFQIPSHWPGSGPAQEDLGRIDRTKELGEGYQETSDEGDRSLFEEERRDHAAAGEKREK